MSNVVCEICNRMSNGRHNSYFVKLEEAWYARVAKEIDFKTGLQYLLYWTSVLHHLWYLTDLSLLQHSLVSGYAGHVHHYGDPVRAVLCWITAHHYLVSIPATKTEDVRAGQDWEFLLECLSNISSFHRFFSDEYCSSPPQADFVSSLIFFAMSCMIIVVGVAK